MKKEIEKIQENFGEITDNLQKLGQKLRNDFFTGTMELKDQDNDIKISSVENPSGDNFVFENNSFQLSSLSSLELINSNFINNTLSAAHLKNISLKNSDLSNCKIQGSAISNLSLEEGEMNSSELNAAKLANCSLNASSSIDNSKLTGISFKNVTIKNQASIIDSTINLCVWSDTLINNSSFEKLELTGVVLDSVVFENVVLKNLKWTDVILNNVSISNVELSDFDLAHLHLKDETITSQQKLRELIKKKGLL